MPLFQAEKSIRLPADKQFLKSFLVQPGPSSFDITTSRKITHLIARSRREAKKGKHKKSNCDDALPPSRRAAERKITSFLKLVCAAGIIWNTINNTINIGTSSYIYHIYICIYICGVSRPRDKIKKTAPVN
jgi:hypothetical protein